MTGVNEMSVQRLLQQFEHEIVDVNRKNIRAIAGEIGKEELLRIGTGISICRAKYLKLVLEMTKIEDGDITTAMLSQVRNQRLLYEETMLSFDALRHALERGYIVAKEG